MILVDSNVWIYYLDATLPEHEETVVVLEEIIEREEIAITVVVAIETIHYLFKRLGTNIGKKKAEIFLRYPFMMIDLTGDDMVHVAEILAETSHLGIEGRDASILVGMQREGIKTIITHDEAFKRTPEVEVVDPIGEKTKI